MAGGWPRDGAGQEQIDTLASERIVDATCTSALTPVGPSSVSICTSSSSEGVPYLPHIKVVSPHTIKAYRDAFKLFLPYAAHYHGIKISSLQVKHLWVEVVLDFLDHLEKSAPKLGQNPK